MTVSVFEDRPETARGRMLYATLVAVHANIRSDLASVEQLTAAVLDGLPADGLHEELATLKSNSLLWQFQISCLRYCSFVHMHHNAEDMLFFDELEQTNPAITPVVERLRADHRAVSDYLDAVETTARALTDDDTADTRRPLPMPSRCSRATWSRTSTTKSETSPPRLAGYATFPCRRRGPRGSVAGWIQSGRENC